MSYRYFSHEIDGGTHYCTRCGKFLVEIQENTRWVGNEVFPACVDAANVLAISHIARSHRDGNGRG
jgi:hypothetical protein